MIIAFAVMGSICLIALVLFLAKVCGNKHNTMAVRESIPNIAKDGAAVYHDPQRICDRSRPLSMSEMRRAVDRYEQQGRTPWIEIHYREKEIFLYAE